MEKNLIITITDYNNYGNQLQNYALQTVIEKLNTDVITLENDYMDKETINLVRHSRKITIIRIIKSIISRVKKIIIDISRKTVLKDRYKKDLEKKLKKVEKGQIFSEKYIKKSIEEQKNKKNFLTQFDYIVIGSDQIWNPYFMKSIYIDFAQFAEKNKKITYAASLGVEKIPDILKTIYKDNIKPIKYVSVRENAGRDILKEITNRNDIEVLIDPTMLLTKEEWIKIEEKPIQLKDKKYILNYFLGRISKKRRKEIEKIAKENDCKIINILDPKDPFYTSGPSEFLYLERNAFLICTDSFHACAFAILFNVPFAVFDRKDKSANMNSRIETLLSTFKLEERYCRGGINKELLKANYIKQYKILEEERYKSYKFLKKALNIEENSSESENQ